MGYSLSEAMDIEDLTEDEVIHELEKHDVSLEELNEEVKPDENGLYHGGDVLEFLGY